MSTTLDHKARLQQQKEATRSRIVRGGNRLFSTQGYAETSMEDIAREADISIRTIYLHFESKASILLAYFDEWLGDFVDALCSRPVDEPVDETVSAALDHLFATGWDDRSFADMARPFPVAQFIGDGPPEIAGRMMHEWVRAQDRLAADTARRGNYPADSLIPRARAASIFASWVALLLVFRDGFESGGIPPAATGRTVGQELIREMTRGK